MNKEESWGNNIILFGWIHFTRRLPLRCSSLHIRLFHLLLQHELHSSSGVAESTSLQVWWSRQVARIALYSYSLLEQPCQDLSSLDRVSIACGMPLSISILTLYV